MPWHRSTAVPKAHWVLLSLGLTVTFAALVLAGIARYPGVVERAAKACSAHRCA